MCIYEYIYTPYIYTTGKFACGSRGVTNELYMCMYRYMDMYFYVHMYIIYLPQVYLRVGHGVSKLSFALCRLVELPVNLNIVPLSRATRVYDTHTHAHAHAHMHTHTNSHT